MKLISIATFLISTLFLLPVSMALITCDVCETGRCSCHVYDCKSGILDVFSTIDCSGAPSYEYTFNNSEGVWPPAESYTYYLAAFCDDGATKSDCNTVAVKQGTTTFTTTTTEETATTTTSTKTTTKATTTTSIPIYGPYEHPFEFGIRMLVVVAVIVLISVWAYSRM